MKVPGGLKRASQLGNMAKYTISEDIHNYARKMERGRKRLLAHPSGKTAIEFLAELGLRGITPARQCLYLDRLFTIMKQLEKSGVHIRDVSTAQCKEMLADIIAGDYAGETKSAYAMCLQRFVHYAKTGLIGDRRTGYAEEVAWIMPSKYRGRRSNVRKKDLLTPEEFVKIVKCTKSVRDRAMLWVMYEGAFRPGEMLNMRVGGIEFADEYVIISTHGKTDQKSVALVFAFRPLLDWLEEHPLYDDPDAPLWWSKWSHNGCVNYPTLSKVVTVSAARAGITKRVWGYLLRHSQLTHLATKLPDQILRVYGNWSPGSRMVSRYTHLSSRDAMNAVLSLHGIAREEPKGGGLMVCPRCNKRSPPDVRRCTECGYMLDEAARAALTRDDLEKSRIHSGTISMPAKTITPAKNAGFRVTVDEGLFGDGMPETGGVRDAQPGSFSDSAYVDV